MAILLNKERPAAAKVTVDHPKQNEIVKSREYAIRLSAPEDVKGVEVAIEQGEWQPCRQAVGYWWFDWSGYADGEHEVVARMETKEGKKITSVPCEFFVESGAEGKPSKS